MGFLTWRSGAVAGVALVSVLVFHLSVLAVFFLLPIAWLEKKGFADLVPHSVLMTVVGFVAWTWLWKLISREPWAVWDTWDAGLPVVLVLGWFLVRHLSVLRWRYLFRLAAVTLAGAVIGLPVVMSAVNDPLVQKAWRAGFELVWAQLAQASSVEAAGTLTDSYKQAFFGMVKESVCRAFLPVLFLFWAGTEALTRRLGWTATPVLWTKFQLPTWGVFAFLGLWTLLLLQNLWRNLGGSAWNGAVWYLVENLAVVVWIVYAFAGWGVLRFLMDGRKVAIPIQSLIGVFLVLCLISANAASVIVMVILPLLAVLELWVNFRKMEQRG
jgi:hypothetical protein